MFSWSRVRLGWSLEDCFIRVSSPSVVGLYRFSSGFPLINLTILFCLFINRWGKCLHFRKKKIHSAHFLNPHTLPMQTLVAPLPMLSGLTSEISLVQGPGWSAWQPKDTGASPSSNWLALSPRESDCGCLFLFGPPFVLKDIIYFLLFQWSL